MFRDLGKQVPLNEVVIETLIPIGDKIFLKRTGWQDLNSVERALVSTIIEGKHSEAAELANIRGGYAPAV